MSYQKTDLEDFIVLVRLIELRVRRDALRCFTLNKDANFEANIIDKQIDELEGLLAAMEKAGKEADDNA